MKYLIRALAFANDVPCPHAGEYLKAFDHEALGGIGFGEFTPDPSEAMQFDSAGEAMAFWNRQSRVRPLRQDGKPNKPLTALTASIDPMPTKEHP